jgi:hypothetical protein
MFRRLALVPVLAFLFAMATSAADLPAFLSTGSPACDDRPSLDLTNPAPVQKVCGPTCEGSYRMPYTGSTLASDYTCSGATTGLNNVLLASANTDCQNLTGRNSCAFSVTIVTPCYQFVGGTLWYVGGYATYSCKDTSC